MSDHIDGRLRALHATTGQHLDALLDLDTGLREVLTAARHDDMGRTLDQTLDLDAGLGAIVPDPAAIVRTSPRTDVPNRDRVFVSAVARWLMAQDASTRLAIRARPAMDAITMLFILDGCLSMASALKAALAGGTAYPDDIRTFGAGLCRVMDRGLRQARSIGRRVGGHDVDHALRRVGELARELAAQLGRMRRTGHVPIREHAIALDRVRVLRSTLDSARTVHSDRTLDMARATNQGLALALIRDLALVRGREGGRGRNPFSLRRFDHHFHLVRELGRARNDFTTADLRDVDLDSDALNGVRWSDQTRWPSQTWKDQAVRDSTEIEPGVYEIRRGMTHISTGTLPL